MQLAALSRSPGSPEADPELNRRFENLCQCEQEFATVLDASNLLDYPLAHPESEKAVRSYQALSL